MFNYFLVVFLENLSAAELKKLRNKQRKAKKKAELESAQQQQALVKKEQYNKSRQQQNQDGDPEAPQLVELIPDKLARPEDPLEKAIEFLRPLISFASNNIETHLLAFEIYYRKGKLLLMLQSLKRANKIDSTNPKLLSCFVRFIAIYRNTNGIHDVVKSVIETALKDLSIANITPIELNKKHAKEYAGSYVHQYECAKLAYELDNSQKSEALKTIKTFNLDDVCLEVI